MDVNAILPSLADVKKALKLLASTLALTTWMWPHQAVVQDCATYDYIVVGAGTAGSIVANRLTEDKNVNVLVLEAGYDTPLESVLAGLFYLLPHTEYDWKYQSVNNGIISQYTKNKSIELTAGKVLGGGSSHHHLIYSRGHPDDYNAWAEVTGDKSWTYPYLLPYFNKFEDLLDKKVLESPDGKLFGTKGNIKLTREYSNKTKIYLNAFEEIGHNVVIDTNGYNTLGYTIPLLYIGDGLRQSTANGYLRNVKKRPNFNLMKETTVVEVIFNEKVAIGVKAVNNGETYTFYAKKEVIVCAGAFNTPKLLMLSGIGPENHLKSLDWSKIKGISKFSDRGTV